MLKKYYNSNIIFFARNTKTKIEIPIIVNNSRIAEVYVEKNNKTVDFVPIYYNNRIVNLLPVVLLDENASLFTVIHELCHLLSIEDYVICGNKVFHSFGILSFRYQLLNGKFKLVKACGNHSENERITNLITEIIMNYITTGEVCSEEDYKIVFRYFHIH